MNEGRILIIDDDARLSSLLRTVLKRVGYDVLEENRPFAALSSIRAFRPHLILLDVDMPGQDGGQIAAQVAADPALSATPIIFVTSLVHRNESGRRGGTRYLSKPVETCVLLTTVDEVIGGKAA